MYDNIQYEFCKIKNIKNTINRLENKNILDEIELFEIKNFAVSSNKIIENYSKLNIKVDYIKYKSVDAIVKLLDPDDLKLTTFQIYGAYSKRLLRIRQNKINIEKTIFSEADIEKIEMLKKERLEIVVQEEQEELKIRKALSEKLYNYLNDINENIKSIGKLDLLIAKANLAIKYNAIKPSINNENKIYFKDLLDPNLERLLSSQGKKYIPISIEIDKKITIISGANMGGKSVSIKTIALNLYLFQCGFYVFAKEANLCILDFIYVVSDDMQDINKGLSTFGAEIIKLKEITKFMKIRDGFVALDEFARGTNPIEGRVLLKATCEYFKKYNSVSLISTHLDDINIDDATYYQVRGLKNVDFEGLKRQIDLKIGNGKNFNSIKLLQEYMDYRLEKVDKEAKVPKDAINICKLLGLDNEIINIADKLSK
ncbi:MutS-related protein [Romboutsia sp.]|uniref:lysine 5,6-aminomutase reactivase ATPase KamC n=1 Tax=Romboutsia sp. TaxID=1965302 RepID=UPI003F3A43D9